MFLYDEVVGVTVEFFETEEGRVAVVDFIDGRGEAGPDFLSCRSIDMRSGSKGL